MKNLIFDYFNFHDIPDEKMIEKIDELSEITEMLLWGVLSRSFEDRKYNTLISPFKNTIEIPATDEKEKSYFVRKTMGDLYAAFMFYETDNKENIIKSYLIPHATVNDPYIRCITYEILK